MIDPLTFIALLPAVVLVVYICRKDRTDKEPPALLAKLLGFGALSCLPAIVVELILSAIIERLNVRNVYLGYFLEAFVVAGLTEETCKFLFLRTTWRSPAFDFQFDAIVYAVMVALGFAAFENVKYVYSYGFATGLVRAVTAVPGHAIFGVFIGLSLFGFMGVIFGPLLLEMFVFCVNIFKKRYLDGTPDKQLFVPGGAVRAHGPEAPAGRGVYEK